MLRLIPFRHVPHPHRQNLPGIDCIHVLKFIRSRPDLERLPVFPVSNSNYFSGIAQTAYNEGATCFIQKGDLSPAGLIEEVRNPIPSSVLIPDVTMPIKDGFKTLAAWKQDPELHDGPMIMLTASKDEEKQHKALRQGESNYPAKPFSPDALRLGGKVRGSS